MKRRLDYRACAERRFSRATRLHERQERGWVAGSHCVGEPSRKRKVSVGRPEADEDVHDAAAGTDLFLVEVAGKVDFSEPCRTTIFK